MLQALTLDQLYRFETNYRKASSKFRSKYSLEDILDELRRRHSMFGQVYRTVFDQLRVAPDHLITYRHVWDLFYPGQPWVWRKSDKAVKKILDELIRYCVLYSLPIITGRVVRRDQPRPDNKATENIYSRCQQLHVPVGPSPEQFVAQQMTEALSLLAQQQ